MIAFSKIIVIRRIHKIKLKQIYNKIKTIPLMKVHNAIKKMMNKLKTIICLPMTQIIYINLGLILIRAIITKIMKIQIHNQFNKNN